MGRYKYKAPTQGQVFQPLDLFCGHDFQRIDLVYIKKKNVLWGTFK